MTAQLNYHRTSCDKMPDSPPRPPADDACASSIPMTDRQQIIEQAWDARAGISASGGPTEVRDAVESAIADLDAGTLRVAEKKEGEWITHQWLKKAVLLSFRLRDNGVISASGDRGFLQFYDKVSSTFKAGMRRVLRLPAFVSFRRPWHDAARFYRKM